MDKRQTKIDNLKRIYSLRASEGFTHKEISQLIHKHNRASSPLLSTQEVDDLCHMGYYHFDDRTAEIANGLD